MLKECILHDIKIHIKGKQLIFSALHKALISRVFASEGESARKYSLIFRGRTENSDEKSQVRRVEKDPTFLPPTESHKACPGLKPRSYHKGLSHRINADPTGHNKADIKDGNFYSFHNHACTVKSILRRT